MSCRCGEHPCRCAAVSADLVWGDAFFVGGWTLPEAVAFVKRVHEIAAEESARQAAPPPEAS